MNNTEWTATTWTRLADGGLAKLVVFRREDGLYVPDPVTWNWKAAIFGGPSSDGYACKSPEEAMARAEESLTHLLALQRITHNHYGQAVPVDPRDALLERAHELLQGRTTYEVADGEETESYEVIAWLDKMRAYRDSRKSGEP